MLDRIYPAGTFNGRYEARGDIYDADCIIAHTFGDGPGSSSGQSNESLAAYAVNLRQTLGDVALIAAKEIAAAAKEPVDHAMSGDLADWLGAGTGTWGELQQAKQFMDQHNLSRPALVAHSYHIGRVARQAELLDIDPIVPKDLPEDFDKNSVQAWTRNSILWAVRTIPGNIVLKLQSRL